MPELTTGARLDPALAALVEKLVEQKVEERVGALSTRLTDAIDRIAAVETRLVSDRATILVFSGEFDKLMSAFIVATGAVAMGFEVSMYFTFWGLIGLKKQTVYSGKTLPEKMIAAMLPAGPHTTGTSKMNMGGLGPLFFKYMMANKNVETLPGMIAVAQELEVKMIACQMAMDVMGIKQEELIDGLEYGGAATYLADACDSKLTLFI